MSTFNQLYYTTAIVGIEGKSKMNMKAAETITFVIREQRKYTFQEYNKTKAKP